MLGSTFGQRLVSAALIGWFAVISSLVLRVPAFAGCPVHYGCDAVVYANAARTLLAGGDPWAPGSTALVFAAPPLSALPYLPFIWLPDALIATAWVLIGIAASAYAVRRLRLPLWWLVFPPLVAGVSSGSTAPLVLALLVRGGVVADGFAVVTRVYAAVPLLVLGRWRGLVAAAAVGGATLPFLQWDRFVDQLPTIQATLSEQARGGLSAAVSPVLVVIAVAALLALGRRRAAWLAVPALWPDTQLYYASIAMPVLVDMPIVAFALATPLVPGLIAGGLAAQAVVDRLTWWRRHGRSSYSGSVSEARSGK